MKKILITIIALIYIVNVKALDINSEYAILYNLNEDKIIYEKNSQDKTPIASLTKIMTAIVALENIDDINEYITLPKEAFNNLNGYVKAGFKINEKVTYKDLLYGLLLPSGAECANAIAILVGGNIDNFVILMNNKAKALGLTNTNFSNPIGMDEGNYSTASDVAALLKYALKNKQFFEIFTTRKYIATNNLILESTILEKAKNFNLDPKNILGAKTGFTDDAGYCLASIAKIDGVKYLFVTIKGDTDKPTQLIDAINTYDYYSKNYSYKKILTYNQSLISIPIKNGIEKEYQIYSEYDKYEYLNNNIDIKNIKYEYEGIKEITKNLKKDDYLGKIKILYENKAIYEYPIYLKKTIKYIDYKKIAIGLLAIIIILIYKIKHKCYTKK